MERFPEAGAGRVIRVLRHLERVGRVVRTGGWSSPAARRALRRTAARALVAGGTLGVGMFKISST
ncbi:MAG: hypothetical protein R3F43_12690 [bacterium]